MEIQEREPTQQTEIEEIQEEEEEEEEEDLNITSNKEHKKWFKWVGPTFRKATIASVAAMATPVIIPQLIVLTTVGGTLCIPFGVYLGTVALTDKFMSYIFRVQRGEVELGFDQDGDYQIIYTEEEAKEQIEIIRSILGYKSPKQPSNVEEFHAILNFIGIKPPLKEYRDQNEVSSTIHLVKSLIGVK